MQRIALATTLLASSIAADDTLLGQLNQWNKDFGPAYLPKGVDPSNTNDLLARLQAAKTAIAAVSKSQPQATFALGPFAMYSPKEFRDYILRSYSRGSELSGAPEEATVDRGIGAANGTVDWSATKCMPPVGEQGKCSSSWVFATTAAVETAHCIVTGTPIDVSEQDIVSCDRDELDEGCRGGIEYTAIDWISKNGICLAKDYPYTSGADGKNSVCQTTCAKQQLAVDGHAWATGEPKLEAALAKQPVASMVEASNDIWQHYASGIITSCPGSPSDHSVLVVGYGTDKTTNFFKVRNSWGVKWGEQGYARVRRGVGGNGMCQIAELPVYPKMKGTPTPTTSPAPTTAPVPTTSKPSC
ncbi:cysteine protease family C01A [Achlya hypogyna]|uniref:Cysteine protease family C01A n=1 Tax=Achlya hypogyna TaxID=1202772 RepID=A0A0A7CPM8_ACHHY|nr:secreted protein [Achlya hypogyna]OQR80875.1 cysteine protease family C01A [Achlya hypogyna]